MLDIPSILPSQSNILTSNSNAKVVPFVAFIDGIMRRKFEGKFLENTKRCTSAEKFIYGSGEIKFEIADSEANSD